MPKRSNKDEAHPDGSDMDEQDYSSGMEGSAPEGSEEDEDMSDVEVDLEFFDPQEQDFHGVRALLSNYLDGVEFNCGEIVDAVIQQSSVGTVVKCGDEGNPIGVASVLSFERYKNASALETVKRFILDHCEDCEKKELFRKVMDGRTSGLLINERLLNCPPQLGPPLQQALFDEISWAIEDEPTTELRESFKFDCYVLMTRAYRDTSLETGNGSKSTQKKKRPKSFGPTGLVYIRPEDEFYHQFSADSFTFPVGNRCPDTLEPLRLVLLLPADRIPQARAALDSIVGNVAAKSNP